LRGPARGRRSGPTKPAQAASVRHFHLATLYPEAHQILSVNEDGQIFDEVHQETD